MVPGLVALNTFSPSGEPSFSFNAFTSVPSSDWLTWGGELAGLHIVAEDIQIAVLEPTLALVNLASPTDSFALSSVTTLSSIALASAPVPNWPGASAVPA